MTRPGLIALAALLATGCVSAGSRTLTLPPRVDPIPSGIAARDGLAPGACERCTAQLDEVVLARSAQRVAELRLRGGECAVYGAVLERSVRGGRVSVRPYMWRAGSRLVSGEATSSGEIVVAREIDPLNVGVRTIDDMVWTLEHEAAHLAFRLANGDGWTDDAANATVRGCRS